MQQKPGETDEEDCDEPDDLERAASEIPLRAAIVWIGTRDPEQTLNAEFDVWNSRSVDTGFKHASNAADAWGLLQAHLSSGNIQATACTFLVPEDFDFNNGGEWTRQGGGARLSILSSEFNDLEPVTNKLAPFSALRPNRMMNIHDIIYRDVRLLRNQLEKFFPSVVREALRLSETQNLSVNGADDTSSKDASTVKAARNRTRGQYNYLKNLYQRVFPTAEHRNAWSQQKRHAVFLEELEKLRKSGETDFGVGDTLFKKIDKEIVDGVKPKSRRKAPKSI